MRPQPVTRPANVRTFGQALRKIRTERGFSHKEVATRVGVKKDQVRQWEDDQATPSNFHLKKLYGTFSTLRFFTELLPTIEREKLIEKAQQIAAATRGVGMMPEDAWLPPIAGRSEDMPEELIHTPKLKTFGDHLRSIRLSEGIDLEELAELMNVTSQAVSAWELDKANPVMDHYVKLRDLFPTLKSAPAPDAPDIPKPDGGKGISRNVGNSHNGGPKETKTTPTLRAVPTAFDAIQMPLAEPNPSPPEEEEEIEAAPPVEVVPPTPLQALEQAGIDYARFLAAKQREEFRLATLKAQIAEAEKSFNDATELVKMAHERLLELATKQ